jgi:hypothetical protein
VIATHRHQLRAVRRHGARGLHPDDIAIIDAIPVTTVHRTFLDLAEVMHPLRLFDALELSIRLQQFDLIEMHAMIAPQPRPSRAQAVAGAAAQADRRRRDRKLTLAGYGVRRVSEFEFTTASERVFADLRSMLNGAYDA